MSPTTGDGVPDIALTTTGEKRLKLSNFRGENLMLFFYPKASTPGCTTEGQDFRDAADAFAATSTRILGASRDGLKAQENFKAKHAFPFDPGLRPRRNLVQAVRRHQAQGDVR